MPNPYRAVLAVVSLATAVSASLPTARSYFEARRDPRLPAVFSIQKHLEEVESHLRAHPPAGLDAGQAAARTMRLDELRDYRLRGDFPRNLDFPDRVLPYFIDARGIACAVGHLIILSGDRPLAEAISRTLNHAYIPEIKDSRLAAWAGDNGLTLEELARIQPSYTAGYADIFGLALDGGNRPWVVTGDGVTYGGSGYVISRLGAEGWSHHSGNPAVTFRDFCLVGGRPLLVHHRGLSWNGGEPGNIEVGRLETEGRICEAMPDGNGFWIGGKTGLWRFSVDASGPPLLAGMVRAGDGGFPGDTVHSIAASGDRLWVGTSQGLAYRQGEGAWSTTSYSDLSGAQPGGIEADGRKGAWIGRLSRKIDKWQDDRVAFPFSETGVARMDSNGQVTWYSTDNSALPSNTILQAAPAKDGGVWLATNERRLVHFLPPDRLTVVPTVLPLHINAMKVDAEGRLHVGTFGGLAMTTPPNAGLYRQEGDSLAWIGYPAPPASITRQEGRHPGRAAAWRNLLGSGGDGHSALDLLGRRFRASGR